MKIILLLICCLQAKAETVDELFKARGLKIGLHSNTRVLKALQRKGSRLTFTNAKFAEGRTIFDLDISGPLSLSTFERTRNNITAVIENSYRDQPTPYQGEITVSTKCPDEFRPKRSNHVLKGKEMVQVVESLVDANFNLGICEKARLKHRLCTAFYFQRERSLFIKLKTISELGNHCEPLSVEFLQRLQLL